MTVAAEPLNPAPSVLTGERLKVVIEPSGLIVACSMVFL